MRAGSLVQLIAIDRPGSTVDDYGSEVVGWTAVTTTRAQLVQASTEEFLRSFGTSSEISTIFRTRFINGLTLSDRITHNGNRFDLVEIKEIGRRKGLELRCKAAAGE